MYETGYYATEHYATGYYMRGVGVVLGGSQFAGHELLVFKPILDLLKSELPVDAEVIPYSAKTETEFEIDGKSYKLVAKRTPSEIIKASPDIEKILDRAAKKLGISRRRAKKELYKQIIKELKKVESVKDSVFNDDEEIIMILVATDDI